MDPTFRYCREFGRYGRVPPNPPQFQNDKYVNFVRLVESPLGMDPFKLYARLKSR